MKMKKAKLTNQEFKKMFALLSEGNQKKYKKILKRRKDNIISKNLKEFKGSITNEISKNQEEIKDAGIIVCAFNDKNTPIRYIRTEPLIYFKEKNFDILLYGNKTIVLISIKGMISDNALSQINSLKDYSQEVLNNVDITNTIENKKMKILDYYKQLVNGEINEKEFVLSTHRCVVTKVLEKSKTAGFSFCLWELSEKNNKIYIANNVIKCDNSRGFVGHRNGKLNKYLSSLFSKGKAYSSPLTFIFSSSRYWKAINMSIPLFKKTKNYFDYKDWCKIFENDLMNWHEIEKEKVYEKYIEYGISCKFIKCKKDDGDVFKNKFSISSRYSSTSSLENDLLDKIIRYEVGIVIQDILPRTEKEIVSELLSQQTRESGNTVIQDFPNRNSS